MTPPVHGAIDRQTEEAVGQLAGLLSVRPAATKEEASRTLYQTIYWLWVATRHDLSPDRAVSSAALRGGYSLSESSRRQLSADWRIAGNYGLFTPENLSKLRDGSVPLATDGAFVGQRINIVAIRPNGATTDLDNLALCPESAPLPPAARALSGETPPPPPEAPTFQPVTAPPLMSTTFPWRARPSPSPVGTGLPPTGRKSSPNPVADTPPSPSGIRPEQIEIHDMPFNGSMPLGGLRKLAVAADTGTVLSVSLIGDGPKIHRQGRTYDGGYYSADYPRVDNSKVPKVNPVHLPGITGNAYLIFSEGQARYYYIDTPINNGGAFRIAKVIGSL